MKPSPPLDAASPKHLFFSVNPLKFNVNPFKQLQPSLEIIVLLLAVMIGGGTGLAVVIFHCLIEKIHGLMLENLMGVIGQWGAWTLACVPFLGGLVVGLMRWKWQDFGLSLSSLISASQTSLKVLPTRATAKAIAASISLGTGASLGPEGPSVEIGAKIGILLGQVLKVSHERQRLLLGAGAAAGLAAGFNAPIAGVFFALEVVLGTTFATSAVSIVLLSAVVAALVSQIGLGGQAAFILPSYEVRSPLELPLYLGLGLFASLVSIAYTQAIKLGQRFFQGQIPGLHWMGRIPIPLRPAIGGVCVGMVVLQFPQIFGIGYETIEAMLRDVQFSLPLLIALLVMKLVMTAVSLGSGFVGGLFAPAMFLGASLGAIYGNALPLLPFVAAANIAAPPAYAMVGMAAVLASSVRAPLTAILLLFELTRDYRIILPLMAAVGLSVWLIERLKPIVSQSITVSQPVSTEITDLRVEPNQNLDRLHQLSVGKAMDRDFLGLSGSLSVVEAGIALTQHKAHSALVMDGAEELVGIVTLQDINRAIATWEEKAVSAQKQAAMSIVPNQILSNQISGQSIPQPGSWHLSETLGQTLADICTKELLFSHEEDSLAEAQTRMATRGLRQLPIVDRDNPHRVVGILTQEQIALACSLALTEEILQPYLMALPSQSLPIPESEKFPEPAIAELQRPELSAANRISLAVMKQTA
jgi:H+/Cl- antiporter ClcA/CBS domain-containing protein